MSVQSHKYMCNVINRNIFFDLKKNLSPFKEIKLNKLFPKFQINNVKKIISFI